MLRLHRFYRPKLRTGCFGQAGPVRAQVQAANTPTKNLHKNSEQTYSIWPLAVLGFCAIEIDVNAWQAKPGNITGSSNEIIQRKPRACSPKVLRADRRHSQLCKWRNRRSRNQIRRG